MVLHVKFFPIEIFSSDSSFFHSISILVYIYQHVYKRLYEKQSPSKRELTNLKISITGKKKNYSNRLTKSLHTCTHIDLLVYSVPPLYIRNRIYEKKKRQCAYLSHPKSHQYIVSILRHSLSFTLVQHPFFHPLKIRKESICLCAKPMGHAFDVAHERTMKGSVRPMTNQAFPNPNVCR